MHPHFRSVIDTHVMQFLSIKTARAALSQTFNYQVIVQTMCLSGSGQGEVAAEQHTAPLSSLDLGAGGRGWVRAHSTEGCTLGSPAPRGCGSGFINPPLVMWWLVVSTATFVPV